MLAKCLLPTSLKSMFLTHEDQARRTGELTRKECRVATHTRHFEEYGVLVTDDDAGNHDKPVEVEWSNKNNDSKDLKHSVSLSKTLPQETANIVAIVIQKLERRGMIKNQSVTTIHTLRMGG